MRNLLIVTLLIVFSAAIYAQGQLNTNFLFHNTSLEEIQYKLSSKNVKVNDKCAVQLGLYIKKLMESIAIGKIYENNWAWQIFDSSGKIASGILTGNTVDIGNMDECLAVDVTEENIAIRGKYCYSGMNVPLGILDGEDVNKVNLLRVATAKPSVYSVSICIPDSCSPSELSELVIGIPDLGVDLGCQTADTNSEYDGSDWAFIVFIIIIGVLVICSTTYDLYLNRNENKESPIHPITLAFSFYTNGKKIFHTTNTPNPNQFSSLNGIRAFSVLWVMAGHRYTSVTSIPHLNLLEAFEWTGMPYSQYIQGAPVAVDTFFFMSGLVMTYSFIRSQSKPNAKFNVFLYYLHRYLRLTPALAVVWFFYISLMKHITSGPLYPYLMEQEQSTCTEYWYSLLFYVQNYVNIDQVCMGHTWYLSVDIQIFLISPLILIPLVKFPKYAMYFVIGLLMLSIIPPIVIVYHYELHQDTSDYMKKYYAQPYNRVSPWLVGVLLGIIFVKFQDRKFKISKWLNFIIWCIVLILMFLIIYLGNEATYRADILDFAIFTGLHRMFWAVGLMWIVFACQKGYGGFVNWLLTLPLFQVIARLSYSMYLVHVPMLLMSVFRKRTPQVWDDYEVLSQAFGDIIPITFVALFWCLLFESPMVVIEKFLFGGGKDQKSELPITKMEVEVKVDSQDKR